jgi:hypothetical protein
MFIKINFNVVCVTKLLYMYMYIKVLLRKEVNFYFFHFTFYYSVVIHVYSIHHYIFLLQNRLHILTSIPIQYVYKNISSTLNIQ